MQHAILCALIAILCTACANGQQYGPAVAFPALTFQNPVEMLNAGDGSNRLFVIEKSGIVRVFPNDNEVAKADTFLNIKSRVNSSKSELGLLGIAFHPNYKDNGYFYVNYTTGTVNSDLRTVIARYTANPANPNRSDAATEQILLQVYQPYENHNAGKLAFGPDGYLYISLGDGGSGGDPRNRAQNLDSLLGKMLRIDVNNTANGKNYAIPSDNPLVGNQNGNPEEIWAWGLRNVWKFCFDPETGWLWAADVGQNQYEEIDILEKGRNYGWKIMEAKHCFSSANCDTTGLTQPIWEYPHSQGSSITGGYVYRGTESPALVGKYLYGDYVTGRIWALEYDGESAPINSLLFQTKQYTLSSFGIDENNELYFLTYNEGKIYRIRQLPSDAPDNSTDQGNFLLHSPKPNPATGRVIIPFLLSHDASVTISLFDPIGREVLQLFSGARSAGYHEIAFDASTIPPGTYFCRLSDGTRIETENLLLLPQ